jgi:hypothetical protein
MSLPDRYQTKVSGEPLDPRQVLSDLKRFHIELIEALEAMEVATQAATPDKSGYSHARWKLGTASRNRRSLVGKICQQLIPSAAPADAAILKELHSDDVKMLHESAAHVGVWTLEMIETRWAEYCQASREIRAKMIERIDMERRRLFPILERAR